MPGENGTPFKVLLNRLRISKTLLLLTGLESDSVLFKPHQFPGRSYRLEQADPCEGVLFFGQIYSKAHSELVSQKIEQGRDRRNTHMHMHWQPGK
jgi:hypothetical protein